MLKSKKKYGLLLILFIVISLAGCGGGGSSSSGGSKPTPIYHISGTGVVLQGKQDQSEQRGIDSQIFAKSALSISINPTLKQLDLKTSGFKPQTFKAALTTLAVDQDFLKENTAYIVLTWDQVNGAGRYQVFYGEEKVWDSKDSHPNDPDGTRLDIAYLDLDDELSQTKLKANCIDKPGQYDFRVYALKSNTDNTVIYQFATVTVSLGMILVDFPTEIEYDSVKRELTWKGVTGADGYRVQIYEDPDYATKAYDSGSTLLTTTSCDLTGTDLVIGKQYFVIVNAYAVDGSGNPLEITRGIQK